MGSIQYLLTFLYSLSVPDSSRLNRISGLGGNGTFGAAEGDISLDISGGACDGTIDRTLCDGQSPVHGYVCPKGNCGMS